MKRTLLFSSLLLIFSAISVAAQGVRKTVKTTAPAQQTAKTTEQTDNTTPKAQPAPQTFAAQYQGGMFGYQKKIKGTLAFDDQSKRLVFRNKEGKEVFGIPYKSLLVVYGASKSYTPTAATVGTYIPLPGAGLLGLVKSKNRFLVVEYNDPDSEVRGGTSFKVADKNLMQSVVQTLGEKAEMKQRGDAFYRPREERKPIL